MDIHEYQAKELLSKFGVPIPRGGLAYSPEQATYRATEIGGNKWVVKAQIHSGARGKAGGIKVCSNDTEIERAAEAMLGKKLVDASRPAPRGKLVSRLYIEEAYRHRQGDLPRVRYGPRLRAHRGRRLGAPAAWRSRRSRPSSQTPSSASSSIRPSACSSSRRARWLTVSASSPRSSTSWCRPSWAATAPSAISMPRWSRSTRSSSPRTRPRRARRQDVVR